MTSFPQPYNFLFSLRHRQRLSRFGYTPSVIMERRTGPLYGGLAVRHIGIGRAYLKLRTGYSRGSGNSHPAPASACWR
jgi:hypothetical protein